MTKCLPLPHFTTVSKSSWSQKANWNILMLILLSFSLLSLSMFDFSLSHVSFILNLKNKILWETQREYLKPSRLQPLVCQAIWQLCLNAEFPPLSLNNNFMHWSWHSKCKRLKVIFTETPRYSACTFFWSLTCKTNKKTYDAKLCCSAIKILQSLLLGDYEMLVIVLIYLFE